jgi:glucosamine kinase
LNKYFVRGIFYCSFINEIKFQYTDIADSGSTKTAWIYTRQETPTETIHNRRGKSLFPKYGRYDWEWKESPVDKLRGKVSHVYFYAAGVVNDEKAEVIKRRCMYFFRKQKPVLKAICLAAAHATLGKKAGLPASWEPAPTHACITGRK